MLKHLSMLPGSPERPATQHLLKPDRFEVLAPVAGIFKHLLDAGEMARSGQLEATEAYLLPLMAANRGKRPSVGVSGLACPTW